MKTCVVLMLPLLLLPLLPGEASPQASFVAPRFRIGEEAVYEYVSQGDTRSLTLVVEGLGRTLDMSAREVDVATVAWRFHDQTLRRHVSLASMLAESEAGDCPLRSNGQCTPWSLVTWGVQGEPGVWGAMLVHGRTLAVGQGWTVAGECRACLVPIAVVIEPPRPDSPPGTAYVLNVTSVDAWGKHDLLHMGLEHAFPLQADQHLADRLLRFRLVRQVPSDGTPVPSPAVPAAPGYVSALPPSVPFVDRRPVEGTPARDYPSWAEARAAAGPDPLDLDPGLILTEASYLATPFGLRVDQETFATERYTFISAGFAEASGANATGLSYQRREGRLGEAPFGEPGPWQVDGHDPATYRLDPSTRCAESSPPLWDVARAGEATGLLTDLRGYAWDTWRPPWGGCHGWLVSALGPSHPSGELPVGLGTVGAGSGLAESVSYDAATGRLVQAWRWPRTLDVPEPPALP